MHINTNFQKLPESYLFSTIGKKVRAYTAEHPDASIIKMGIGDVTQPLCPAATQAMHQAVSDLERKETFHGYAPEAGYDFLLEAIQASYAAKGVSIKLSEICVGDGAKSDIGNILDIFGPGNTVLVPDPVYPVYVDTNLMAGNRVLYASASRETGFLPVPDPTVPADLIYLCSPNNPTGAAFTREQLKAWVDYANQRQAVILYDAAYEAFITTPGVARSIFEIEGARTCAIEFCSMSKTAGFTGVRCGYTVIPDELVREGVPLGRLWLRRQSTKFNGLSYITQRGAAAALSPEGRAQCLQTIALYRENARVMTAAMEEMGIWYSGGADSPYVWLECPGKTASWDFFDLLLNRIQVVGTPGSGFGTAGEGYFRLTAFGTLENTVEAMRRMKTLFAKA